MPTLRQALQEAIDRKGGCLPFDEFMQIALHDPQNGYYARNIRGIGPRGDFTTIPRLTKALAAGIADWLRTEAAKRGWRKFHVIECGPGDGSLAADVMKHFGWFERRRISLHLVETSAPLRHLQEKRLRGASWHGSIEEALDACSGRALVYHNEFLDAFPCRVFRREKDGWTERHLRVADGKLAETFLAPQRPFPDSAAFGSPWPEGQRIEVFESAHGWIEKMAASWREGAMLVIDYGGAPEEIYHRRPGGTLRAYRGHERLTGEAVLELPGRQDITADVNFSDLRNWLAASGCIPGTELPLRDFLGADAPGELIDPAGSGEAFRCLAAGKPGRD